MKTINNVDDLSDDLCLYCPLDDGEKGTHGVPNGYISCEGRCCQEAYEEKEIKDPRRHKSICTGGGTQ